VPFLIPADRRDAGLQRGKHDIYDELTFSNHNGYVFHDSGGFECGDNKELEVVQNFVREKSTAKRLQKRLHAIWYFIFIVFLLWDSLTLYCQVLHPNGQPTAVAGLEAFS
jgi:hypothetical protein